jgi:kynurenine formamidase
MKERILNSIELTEEQIAGYAQKLVKDNIMEYLYNKGYEYAETKIMVDYLTDFSSTETSLLGVEPQSVGDPAAPAEIHKILLSAGIVPLEGIVLDDVPDGEFTLSAFPLNLGKCDGSPVRAILIK